MDKEHIKVPTSDQEAAVLAQQGEAVLTILQSMLRQDDITAEQRRACQLTLALIGSTRALDLLSDNVNLQDEEEQQDLWDFWLQSPNQEAYARLVLAPAFREQETLDLRNNMKSLEGIQYFPRLRFLDLMWNRELKDLSPLAALSQLQELILYSCISLEDLSPLAELSQLKKLCLGDCFSLRDISPLAGLTQLQKLYLTGDSEEPIDLSPLAGLTQLRALIFARYNAVQDLSPLASLTQLQKLSLGFREMKDLSPLAGLTQLQELILQCDNEPDLSPLAGLTQLHTSVVGQSRRIALSRL